MDKETESNINELQLLEQNLQNFAMQRQNFQAQVLEIDNALKELDKAEAPYFKIVGNIMVASDKESLKKDLESKKDILELRMKSVKKQEDALNEKMKSLQEKVMKELQGK
ncbi:prefoldin subunit beta [Candidatus Woesearchaeota archaeon]|nr:MAG: prefoldin subunit beta [Candidatus Woesearchaeota archaeon]